MDHFSLSQLCFQFYRCLYCTPYGIEQFKRSITVSSQVTSTSTLATTHEDSESSQRNRCLGLGENTPSYMSLAPPGDLMQVFSQSYMPPAEAPNPVLTTNRVMEPPLPSASTQGRNTSPGGGTSAVSPTSPNGQPKRASCFFLTYLALLLAALFLS